jgi:hypothetical protein
MTSVLAIEIDSSRCGLGLEIAPYLSTMEKETFVRYLVRVGGLSLRECTHVCRANWHVIDVCEMMSP